MTSAPKDREHVIVTVHGIRTYGRWQEALEKLVRKREPGADVFNYHYGYFSVLAFLFPPARWVTTLRFRRWLRSIFDAHPAARVDLVAHSFGTHLVGWSLYHLAKETDFHVHTVILAGSVLKPGFPWDALMQPNRVERVVNECGTRDNVLLLNQLAVLFTGMAGRVGFVAGTGERFRNRYFRFSHSGYFRDESGKLSDAFMEQQWVPLLTGEKAITIFDERSDSPSAGEGFLTFLLNNAEPLKIALYSLPLAVIAVTYWALYREVQSQAYRANIVASQTRLGFSDYDGAREFMRAASSFRRGWEARVLERVLDRSVAEDSVRALSTELIAAWNGFEARYEFDSPGEPANVVGVYDRAKDSMLDPALIPPDLTARDSYAVSPDRRKVAVWTARGIEVRSLDGQPSEFVVAGRWPGVFGLLPGRVLKFSRDGRLLAVLGPIQEVWDVSDLGNVHRRPLEAAPVDSSFADVEFAPSSQTLIYSDIISLYIWELPSGALRFSTDITEPRLLPGVSHYIDSVQAIAFDVRGETVFVAFEGAKKPEAPVDERVTVLAVGTKTTDGGWVFAERSVGDIRVTDISENIVDPERVIFSTRNAIAGFIYRDDSQLFRIPTPSAIQWLTYDARSDRYVTLHGDRTKTWNLQAVHDGRMLFAAREWGSAYPIPGPPLEFLLGIETSESAQEILLYGYRQDYVPFILEHGLRDRDFKHYDLLGVESGDLHMETFVDWNIVDVQEKGARLHALILRGNYRGNPYDWESYPEDVALYFVTWDRTSGQQLAHWRLHPDAPAQPEAPRLRLADRLAPGEGLIVVDGLTGEELLVSTDRYMLPSSPAVISPDGARSVEPSGDYLVVRETDGGEALLTLRPETPLDAAVWALGGEWLVGVSASSVKGQIVQVWDSAP